jgi:hypothetical protein
MVQGKDAEEENTVRSYVEVQRNTNGMATKVQQVLLFFVFLF